MHIVLINYRLFYWCLYYSFWDKIYIMFKIVQKKEKKKRNCVELKIVLCKFLSGTSCVVRNSFFFLNFYFYININVCNCPFCYLGYHKSNDSFVCLFSFHLERGTFTQIKNIIRIWQVFFFMFDHAWCVHGKTIQQHQIENCLSLSIHLSLSVYFLSFNAMN